MSYYKTKKVLLQHNNSIVEKLVKYDLEKVYLTNKAGEIKVYKDTNIIEDGKHLFELSKKDDVVKKAEELKKNNFNIQHSGATYV